MGKCIQLTKQLITGIIHTKNEERNVAQAINSLRQIADEIVVADMNSADRTREIAEELGARVISVPDYGIPEPAFEISYSAAKHPWIFRLDADEILPKSLAAKLLEVANGGDWDVVEIPYLNFFIGRPLLHTGWGPVSDRHTRFFRKSKLQTSSSRVHTEDTFSADARLLKLEPEISTSVWHFNYLDWSHFLEKLNRYTTAEATAIIDSGKSFGGRQLLRACIKEFAWRYLRRRGYKDGYRGAVLTFLMVTYRVAIYAKLRQLREVGDRDSIQRIYADVADGSAEALPGHRITSSVASPPGRPCVVRLPE